MKKTDREKVFNKYGGRCSYCGCALVKGWHVDHASPIIRLYKSTGGYASDGKFTPYKLVPNGCQYPELDCMDNYMPACASCNINKHQMDIEQFRVTISRYMKYLNEASTQYKMAKRFNLIQETIKPIIFYFETL